MEIKNGKDRVVMEIVKMWFRDERKIERLRRGK
jgi:hypothetical protein